MLDWIHFVLECSITALLNLADSLQLRMHIRPDPFACTLVAVISWWGIFKIPGTLGGILRNIRYSSRPKATQLDERLVPTWNDLTPEEKNKLYSRFGKEFVTRLRIIGEGNAPLDVAIATALANSHIAYQTKFIRELLPEWFLSKKT